MGPGWFAWCMSGNLLSSGLNVPFPSVLSFDGGPQTLTEVDCGVGAALHDLILLDAVAELFCQEFDDRLSWEA